MDKEILITKIVLSVTDTKLAGHGLAGSVAVVHIHVFPAGGPRIGRVLALVQCWVVTVDELLRVVGEQVGAHGLVVATLLGLLTQQITLCIHILWVLLT